MRFYPFVFTGKERDEETGYGYFGARYMDHELMTMWISVDPMADKYPSISPYAYCAWNPVKLVDPDGNEIDDYFSLSGKYLGSDNAKTHNVRIISDYSWASLDKDGNGNVDHDLAYAMSKPFSDVSGDMSTDAQLSVYQHYNPTEIILSALPGENKDSRTGGMQTTINKVNDETIIGLNVKIYGNRFYKICDNADEIINLFVHENDHIEKARTWGYDTYLEKKTSNPKAIEESAVSAQRNHPSWNGTSVEFRKRVEDYLKSFE